MRKKFTFFALFGAALALAVLAALQTQPTTIAAAALVSDYRHELAPMPRAKPLTDEADSQAAASAPATKSGDRESHLAELNECLLSEQYDEKGKHHEGWGIASQPLPPEDLPPIQRWENAKEAIEVCMILTAYITEDAPPDPSRYPPLPISQKIAKKILKRMKNEHTMSLKAACKSLQKNPPDSLPADLECP